MRRAPGHLLVCLIMFGLPWVVSAQSSSYTLTFPQADRRAMQVELTLSDVPPGPVELHMSVSSPGRYGPHDFARNVSSVIVTNAAGEPLSVSRSSAAVWRVESPASPLIVRYRISGDRIDGTYLSVDESHAHINMPAALVWAKGFESGPMTIRFEPPVGSNWRIATQLFPGSDARTFTAPNLAYLMDSPTELSAFADRTFTVADPGRTTTFNVVVHHRGTDAQVGMLAADAEKIVRETRTVFGEFPLFESGAYTFIADYLPTANRDGMEHRNSTVLTSSTSLEENRAGALDTMSHEFFHVWNVERVRPRSLEPFDLTKTNVSGELWLAEGFTQYYGPLMLARSGLTSVSTFVAEMSELVSDVLASPATRVRTLEEMSRFAPNVDSPSAPRPPNLRDVYLSYYTWGGAVALALDLSLRERSDDRVTLDDFMRALWERHGRQGGPVPGVVSQPYTMDDVKQALTSVSGDAAFVNDFFARFIQGHEVPDYARLLRRAGLVLRRSSLGAPGIGPLMEVVRAEDAGQTPTDAQRGVRDAWLRSRVAN